MNTAIIAPGGSGGNVGIGFAIPTNMVQQIITQLVEHGEVQRGVLGVVTQDLTMDLAEAFDNTPGSREQFDRFPRSTTRATLEWIKRAKRPETRRKRIAETVLKSVEGVRPR